MGESIAEVAAGLTKAQRKRVMQSEIIVLRTHHDTRVALNLERAGISQRGRHLNQYWLTDLGIAVRNHLISQGADHDR